MKSKLLVTGLLLLSGCTGLKNNSDGRAPASESRVVEWPEGLKGSDLAEFEHLSEGADIYPYEWMKALNSVTYKDSQGNITRPFLSDLNTRFGILPSESLQAANGKKFLMPWVGLTAAWSDHPPEQSEAYQEDEAEIVRQVRGVTSIKMVGTNCSFCHSGGLEYRGQLFRVPGSPSMTNVRGFFLDMARSTLAVLAKEEMAVQFLKKFNVPSPEKKAHELNQFFLRRLGETTHGLVNLKRISGKLTLLEAKAFDSTRRLYEGKQAIAESLEKLLRMTYGLNESDDIGELSARMKFLGVLMVGTSPRTEETISGYARTDAFGRIGNLVLRGDDPIGYTAPVSLPWIWGLKYMAMIHYNGNTNSVMLRNVGQSLGLGAIVLDKEGNSTVNVHNLDRLEALVHKIQVPEWQKIFAGIPELQVRAEMAAAGRKVYESNCMSCHESNQFVGPARNLREYRMFPLAKVGTDPNAAENAVKNVGKIDFEAAIFNGVGGIKAKYYETNGISPEKQAIIEYRSLRGNEFFRDTLKGFSDQKKYQNTYGNVAEGTGYKARHLSGVWSTAPYLHNGSVPTLWDLLQEPDKRPRIFRVKSRDFDPQKMGYNSAHEKSVLGREKPCQKADQSCFDTTLSGNRNTGHAYGTNLSDTQKWALLEYLKVLPPESEYSWPPMGAKNP
jgi:cytochrome c5